MLARNSYGRSCMCMQIWKAKHFRNKKLNASFFFSRTSDDGLSMSHDCNVPSALYLASARSIFFFPFFFLWTAGLNLIAVVSGLFCARMFSALFIGQKFPTLHLHQQKKWFALGLSQTLPENKLVRLGLSGQFHDQHSLGFWEGINQICSVAFCLFQDSVSAAWWSDIPF